MKVLAAGLVAMLSVAAGCGEPDLDLASAGLLQLGDLPGSWSAAAAETESSSVQGFSGSSADEAPDECRRVTSVSEAGAVADGTADTFVTGDPTTGRAGAATSFIWVYRDTAIAEKTLAAWRVAEDVEPCLEVFMAIAMEGMALDPIVKAAVGAYEVAAEPLPSGGSGQVGWRSRLSLHPIPEVQEVVGERMELVDDVVVAQVERAVVLLMFMGIGEPVDAGVREAATSSVIERLSSASSM